MSMYLKIQLEIFSLSQIFKDSFLPRFPMKRELDVSEKERLQPQKKYLNQMKINLIKKKILRREKTKQRIST